MFGVNPHCGFYFTRLDFSKIRTSVFSAQTRMAVEKTDWSLDMDKILQKFWQCYAEIWEKQSQYTVAFQNIMLMAFLHKILHTEGRIDCEFAARRRRTDLCIEYNNHLYDNAFIVIFVDVIFNGFCGVKDAVNAFILVFYNLPPKKSEFTPLFFLSENLQIEICCLPLRFEILIF